MTVKSNKLNDYKKMDEKALVEELKALKSELFKLRLSLAMNGLDNPNKITETKKNIARVNTILTIKQNGGEVVVKASAKKEKAAKKNSKKKEVEAKGEEIKVAIRNVRRDANDKCKQMKKNAQMTEDEQKVVQSLQKADSKQINLIAIDTCIPIGMLSSLLFTMEMKGVVKMMNGGMYRLL